MKPAASSTAKAAHHWQRIDDFLTLLRPHREPLSLLIDAVVVTAAWQFTYLFRLGFERWLSARPSYDAWVLLGIVALYVIVFHLLRVPRGMWRFSGFGEIKRLTIACLAAGLLAGLVVWVAGLREVPRAVLVLHPFFALMGVASVRIGYRMFYEHLRSRRAGRSRRTRRALVLGAGDAARLLLAGIQNRHGWSVMGVLDDDPAKQRSRIAGVSVLGPLSTLAEHALLLDVSHVIVAMPALRGAAKRRVIDLAASAGLPVLTVPSSEELLEGAAVSRVRDIEPDDLLGREPVVLDEAGIGETLRGKTVLITGAGGSIGSELCRQVARYQPQRLVLYELSEFNLYTIEQELTERFPQIDLVRLIGDVKNLEHLRHVMRQWPPQVVFHAAAYKHVPLMEEHNACAALQNNTLGTYNAALASAEAKAERFVLISTDKAVNPTNVMGATKRAAEMVISHLASQGHATRFMAVRFGNVLGSSGSVIPKFKEQIAKGGPVTVTHPDITRYFMTIPEAARLVLQAAAIGETGQVLVLDMGEPVRIVDLARDLIRMAGYAPEEIPIVFSGLRAGEKLYEELLTEADHTLPTKVAQLRIAALGELVAPGELATEIAQLQAGCESQPGDVRQWLRRRVPEYQSAPATIVG